MSIDVTSLYNRRATNRWERVAVGDMIERLTWSYPDKEAIVAWEGAYAHPEHRRLTYRQANTIANRFAQSLLARGLKRGDIVVMVCENSVEAYLTQLAIFKAGLVAAPLNPSLAPDVVAYVLRMIEPKLAVVDAELWPRVSTVMSDLSLLPAVTITIGGGVIPGSRSFRDFLEGASSEEPDVEIHGDDICEILFTSGTTAMPKAAMLSHSNAYFAATSFVISLTRGIKIETDLKLCTFLPMLYHVGGLVFALPVLLAGGTLILGRKPNAEMTAQAISREGATALWGGSPTMVQAVAEVLARSRLIYDPRSLKVVVYGWASLTPGTLASLETSCGPDLLCFEIFGQTEAIACHRFWPAKWRETFLHNCPESNYVGVPSPLLASHIMDADGNSLEGQVGVVGEAVYRSPTVMAGYYKDPEATEKAFAHGWFHSGDSCQYDEDGLRIMVDRAKDIVKTGGENVSSLRVEAVLAQHPDVARVAIIALPHARWGEAVTAVVLRRSADTEVDAAALIAHCRARLGGYETPKGVIFVDSFPETVGGKILKYVLRATHKDLYKESAE